MKTADATILALDVGERRVGVAIAGIVARLPRPFMTLNFDKEIFSAVEQLIKENNVSMIVVGLPRGMSGQETAQTESVKKFAAQLKQFVNCPISYQDEALTSRLAEEELSRTRKIYDKASVDSLAATYILDDFIKEHPELF